MSATLTSLQDQVLESIAAGETATAAAAAAGVHRNTVGNWMRGSPLFRRALSRAHHGQRLCWREQAENRAAAAFAAIDQVLADPQTPAGVRTRVAFAIIAMASTTIEAPYDETWAAAHSMGQLPEEDRPSAPNPPEKAQNVHNIAQLGRQNPGHRPLTPEPSAPHAALAGPKIGRNEPCPCGSGKKFKRCCLLIPAPAHANGFDVAKLHATSA